jgi:3-hydroxyacyl-CoA dehydrogenase/enoyl-CoA hydratase/3-hydroxybutyryl-CoA epimerase
MGLFLGWCGVTGIITKVSLRLFPAKKIRGVGTFVVEDADLADAGVIFGTGFAPFTGGPLNYSHG